MTDKLFTPLTIGTMTLPNRLVMAPLTRNRAAAGNVPQALNVDYYVQRASAGLIISEGTQISPEGQGYLATPGIHSPAQVAGWREVTDAVHAKGGHIFAQLWHVGRVSHTSLQPTGQPPVAPSAIRAKTQVYIATGFADASEPRALETDEIARVVDDYRRAAENAKQAGFDGVELHGANGYLVDQFLRDGSNHRTDAYGGDVERRTRFAVEVAEACANAWAPDRVGFRVSPRGTYNDMADRDPATTFGRLAERLSALKLGYLHVVEGLPGSMMHTPGATVAPVLRKAFRGAFVLNGGYDAAKAAAAIAAGEADAVAFGVPFLCTPDFVARTKAGKPINPPDFSTLYTPGAKGYTDYPTAA